MAISIVTAALVAQPGLPAVAGETSARADEAVPGNDFFSILLALPAMTASAARRQRASLTVQGLPPKPQRRPLPSTCSC